MKPVDPNLAIHVAASPFTDEIPFFALERVKGFCMPDQSDNAAYHADLVRVVASFLCVVLVEQLKLKPKRKAQMIFDGDMALIAYGQALIFLSMMTANDQLISGENWQMIGVHLRHHRQPIDLYLARRQVVADRSEAWASSGAASADLLEVAAGRAGIKWSPKSAVMAIGLLPHAVSYARQRTEQYLNVGWPDLIDPIKTPETPSPSR